MLPQLSDAREMAFPQPSGRVFFQPDPLRKAAPNGCFCETIQDLQSLLTDWGDPISLKFRDKVLAKDNDPKATGVFFRYANLDQTGTDTRDLSYSCYLTEQFKPGVSCQITSRGFFVGGVDSKKVLWRKEIPIDPFAQVNVCITDGKIVCVMPDKYDVLFTPQENLLQMKIIRPAAGRQFLVLPPLSFTWKQLPVSRAVWQSSIRSDEVELISKQGPRSVDKMDPGPSAVRAKIVSLIY